MFGHEMNKKQTTKAGIQITQNCPLCVHIFPHILISYSYLLEYILYIYIRYMFIRDEKWKKLHIDSRYYIRVLFVLMLLKQKEVNKIYLNRKHK